MPAPPPSLCAAGPGATPAPATGGPRRPAAGGKGGRPRASQPCGPRGRRWSRCCFSSSSSSSVSSGGGAGGTGPQGAAGPRGAAVLRAGEGGEHLRVRAGRTGAASPPPASPPREGVPRGSGRALDRRCPGGDWQICAGGRGPSAAFCRSGVNAEGGRAVLAPAERGWSALCRLRELLRQFPLPVPLPFVPCPVPRRQRVTRPFRSRCRRFPPNGFGNGRARGDQNAFLCDRLSAWLGAHESVGTFAESTLMLGLPACVESPRSCSDLPFCRGDFLLSSMLLEQEQGWQLPLPGKLSRTCPANLKTTASLELQPCFHICNLCLCTPACGFSCCCLSSGKCV